MPLEIEVEVEEGTGRGGEWTGMRKGGEERGGDTSQIIKLQEGR